MTGFEPRPSGLDSDYQLRHNHCPGEGHFFLRLNVFLKFQLFPKSKFLLMIRDPRATVDSIVTNKMVLPGYDIGVSIKTILAAK